jgi:hypothetical protein
MLSSSVQPEFSPFPRLPFEIRASIFHEALRPLPPLKVLELHVHIDPSAPFDRHEHESRGRFSTRSQFARFYTPGVSAPQGFQLMWTSSESRAIASTYYSFTCGDIPKSGNMMRSIELEDKHLQRVPKLSNPGIVFNPNKDIIYLCSRHGVAALSYARSSELNLGNIKVLALDLYLWRHYLISRQLFEGWKEDEPFLIGLETLIIVLDSDHSDISDMYNRDARAIGNEAAVEKLRREVKLKLQSFDKLKTGILVQTIHRDELLAQSPDFIMSRIR